MSSFRIIGSGCCGFLRFYQMLKNHVPIKFKGGGPKYQNSFENFYQRVFTPILSDKEYVKKVEEHLKKPPFNAGFGMFLYLNLGGKSMHGS